MHRTLRRMRRTNRGQAMILSVLCLLVLALVVLSTGHIGEVVYEKIRLQNAADNVAYSTAVVEARAYNVVSYINRAMVLHYSTMMTFAAYLSHAQYLDWVIMPIISAVMIILEAFGIPGCTIVKAMRTWYAVLDGHNAFFGPANLCPPPNYGSHGAVEIALAYLTAANEILYLVQEAALVWAGLFILETESFAKQTDPLAELPQVPPTALVGSLPPPLRAATNPFLYSNIRSVYSPTEHKAASPGSLGINARRTGQPVYPNYRGDNLAIDQYSRYLMLEVANAARDEWTAGVKKGTGLLKYFFPRKWEFDLGKILLGSSFACGTLAAGLIKIASIGILALGGGALAVLAMFFGMRLTKTAETRMRGFEGGLRSDQIWSGERFTVNDTGAGKKKSCLCCGITWRGSCKSCVNWICLPPNVRMECQEISRIDLVVALDNGGGGAPTPGLFSPAPLSREQGGHHRVEGRVSLKFFGMAGINVGPFGTTQHKKHYFKGVTPYVLSRPILEWPQVDHFGQPCNFVALVKTLPNKSLKRMWTVKGKTFDPRKQKSLFGQQLGRNMWDRDMAAFAVGRAYYHRPGAWQEPPNFFNPLWHARLAPVREHWEFGNLGGVSMCGVGGAALLPADWIRTMCTTANTGGSAASVVIH